MTTTITRRKALTGAVALPAIAAALPVVASAAVPVLAAGGCGKRAATGDPVLALEVEQLAKEAAHIAAGLAYNKAEKALFAKPKNARSAAERAQVDDLSEAASAACHRADEVDDKIIATPAVSLEGVAFKLQRACFWIDIVSDGPEGNLVESALADLDRLSGEHLGGQP